MVAGPPPGKAPAAKKEQAAAEEAPLGALAKQVPAAAEEPQEPEKAKVEVPRALAEPPARQEEPVQAGKLASQESPVPQAELGPEGATGRSGPSRVGDRPLRSSRVLGLPWLFWLFCFLLFWHSANQVNQSLDCLISTALIIQESEHSFRRDQTQVVGSAQNCNIAARPSTQQEP